MKVLDLQCSQGHSFEGWFASQNDYDQQRQQGLVTCPVCNDSEIVKMLSAPRLNLGHGLAPHQPQSDATSKQAVGVATQSVQSEPLNPLGSDAQALKQIQASVLNMVRQVMANTEDVGSKFAEEARKIHYGEREERNIRGQATRQETEALIEEGIDIMPLPIPENLKGPLQ